MEISQTTELFRPVRGLRIVRETWGDLLSGSSGRRSANTDVKNSQMSKMIMKLEIRGRIETIQTSALLRSIRILSGVLDIYSDSSEIPSANNNNETGNQRKNRDHPDLSIGEIGQNTEKSPEDLRRLAVTQTSVKDHQLIIIMKLEIRGRIETIQTSALVRKARILRRVLDT